MSRIAITAAFAALALFGPAFAGPAFPGLTGSAQAQGCTWSVNHWDCGDRHVYPRWYYLYPQNAHVSPTTGAPLDQPPAPPAYPPRP